MWFVTDAAKVLKKLEIAIKEFKLDDKPLAVGGFGEVYKSKWRKQVVAVKIITVDIRMTETDILNEAILTFRLKHENVVKLIGITHTKSKRLGIVMELADQGSLDKWIGKIDQVQMARVSVGIVNGLEYVHSQRVVHRDIKPRNILMFGPEDAMIPKIADFGVSKAIQTAVTVKSKVGEDLYMAPEVRMFNRYSYPADVYSLAIMLFEMFNEQLIRQSSEEIQMFITRVYNGRIADIPQSCKVPQCLRSVIKRGWDETPNDRPQLVEYRSVLEG